MSTLVWVAFGIIGVLHVYQWSKITKMSSRIKSDDEKHRHDIDDLEKFLMKQMDISHVLLQRIKALEAKTY